MKYTVTGSIIALFLVLTTACSLIPTNPTVPPVQPTSTVGGTPQVTATIAATPTVTASPTPIPLPTATPTPPVPTPTRTPAPPAGAYMLYVDDDRWEPETMRAASNIYRVDLISGKRMQLTNYTFDGEPPHTERPIKWLTLSPDCWQAAFWRYEASGWTLYKMTLDGSAPQKIYSNLAPVVDLAWSPDGQRLAFAKTVQTGDQGKSIYAIFTINNDGSDLRQISPPSPRVSGIFYRPRHPDQVSAGLALDPQASQLLAAYLLADHAGPPIVVPLWGANILIQAWYPSGDKAIVESPVPNTSDFNVSVADVGGGLDLLGPNLWATTPSPDGTMLVFYKEQSGVGGVYISDAAGMNSRRILAAYPRTSYTRLRWTSDSHRLVMLHTGISDEHTGMNDTIETILPNGSGWLHLATGINSIIAGGQIVACGGG